MKIIFRNDAANQKQIDHHTLVSLKPPHSIAVHGLYVNWPYIPLYTLKRVLIFNIQKRIKP